MPITYQDATITKSYTEHSGFPKISFDIGGKITVRTKYQCAYADALALCRELMGGGTVVVAGQANTFENIRYIRPHRYPGITDALCVSANFTNLGGNKVQNGYVSGDYQQINGAAGQAVVEAVYETPSGDGGGGGGSVDQLADEALEPSVEVVRIPGRKFYWTDPTAISAGEDAQPVQIDEAPSFVIPLLTWVVNIKEVIALPTDLIDLTGKVNQFEFRSPTLGYTFPVETVLFMAPKVSRTLSRAGQSAFKVSCTLVYRSTGWNKFLRSGDSEDGDNSEKTRSPQPIYTADGDVFKPYPIASFTPILDILGDIAENTG